MPRDFGRLRALDGSKPTLGCIETRRKDALSGTNERWWSHWWPQLSSAIRVRRDSRARKTEHQVRVDSLSIPRVRPSQRTSRTLQAALGHRHWAASPFWPKTSYTRFIHKSCTVSDLCSSSDRPFDFLGSALRLRWQLRCFPQLGSAAWLGGSDAWYTNNISIPRFLTLL